MTEKQRHVIVAELHAALAVHDEAAVEAMRTAQRHLKRAHEISRRLEQFEKPRRRVADARVAFA